jgi:hypothetical protein
LTTCPPRDRCILTYPDGAQQIDVHDPAPVFQIRVNDGPGGGDPRVIDDDVDTAPGLLNSGRGRFHLPVIANIAVENQRLAARLGHGLRGLPGALVVDVRDSHATAAAGIANGKRATQPAGRARDEHPRRY